MISKPSLYDFSYEALESYIQFCGEPAFRADQTWQGLYRQLYTSFDQFTTLPASLKTSLAEHFTLSPLAPLITLHSQDGQTIKVLFALQDGSKIEAVLMRYEHRLTVCISTQAGCGMGCIFCATGQMGFSRNLSAGEIIAQAIFFEQLMRKEEKTLTNIVLMGMGEPFANYDACMQALDTLNHHRGYNMSARRITLSTVGLVPQINRFAEENRQVNLAISLHAGNDNLRNQLVPINKKYPLAALRDACMNYIQKTNRRITFEYAMIQGVNDSLKDAQEVHQFLHGMLAHLNIIPLNPYPDAEIKASDPEQVNKFHDYLISKGFPCTIRLRRGMDIKAGCGQLASSIN